MKMMVKGETLVNRHIYLDNASHVGCKIEGCILHYAGGSIEFAGNNLKGNRLFFEGPAGYAMNLMAALYAAGGKDMVEQVFQNIRDQAAKIAAAETPPTATKN